MSGRTGKEREGGEPKISVAEVIMKELLEKQNKGDLFVAGAITDLSSGESIILFLSPPSSIIDPQAINKFTEGLITKAPPQVLKEMHSFYEDREVTGINKLTFSERWGVAKTTFTADSDPIDEKLLQGLGVKLPEIRAEKVQDVPRQIIINVYPHIELAKIAAKEAQERGYTNLVRGHLPTKSWKKVAESVSKSRPFPSEAFPLPAQVGW
jgi:hypothetical protein